MSGECDNCGEHALDCACQEDLYDAQLADESKEKSLQEGTIPWDKVKEIINIIFNI